MTRIEWDGGLKITVYEEHKSLRHYRCLRCKSTRVTEYMLETDSGRRNKIKCHGCKLTYLYQPGFALDNHKEHFEEIQDVEVEHID